MGKSLSWAGWAGLWAGAPSCGLSTGLEDREPHGVCPACFVVRLGCLLGEEDRGLPRVWSALET